MSRDLLNHTLDTINVRLVDIGGKTLTLATVITAVLVVVSAYALSLLIRHGIHRALGGDDVGALHVATRLLHYAIVVVGFSVALQTAGVDLRALFAAGAVFAVGIGFAMQNIAQNFVSGVILLVEHSIRPGDVLDLDGRQVRVVEMGIRTTLVRSRDDEVLIVPNSTLVQSTVRSYTLLDTLARVRVIVGVTYTSEMRAVREALEIAARGVGARNKDRDPLVLLTEFDDSAVKWEVSIWVDDPWNLRPSASKLREAIWDALLERKIRMAYPQVDVHFDEHVVDAIAVRAA